MTFAHLVGNEAAAHFLGQMVTQQRVPGALLFLGLEGVGKGLFAEALAKRLLTGKEEGAFGFTHPDLLIFKPEGKLALHSIASMRRLIEEVGLPPYEAPCRVIIVHDAERMLPYSSNALLKTLEEPTSHTYLILIAAQRSALLPTIVSRCQPLYFRALDLQEVVTALKRVRQLSDEEALKLARRARGSPGRALRAPTETQEKLETFLWDLLSHTEDYLELSAKVTQLHGWFEAQRKVWEEEARATLRLTYPESGRDLFEKEVEGAATLCLAAEYNALLEKVEAFFRDATLLQCKGDEALLFYPEIKEKLRYRLQGAPLPSLESVLAHTEAAQTALQRSMPLAACLENLFLELLPS